MKTLFPISLFLLITVLGCNNLSSGEDLGSETTTANPNRTVTDSPVFLNRESFGTIADLGKSTKTPSDIVAGERSLSRTLAEIIKTRESEGVYFEGTNSVPTGVYLFADPQLALGSIAQLYMTIDEVVGDVYIPRKLAPQPAPEPRKPDPFMLIVHTEPDISISLLKDLRSLDADHNLSYNTSFGFVESPESLLSYRAWTGSMEISADESYFINDAQGQEADRGPKNTRVKQRPIDISSIKDELARIIEPVNNEVLIIASDKASYASLLRIFDVSENLKVKFTILVRREKL